MTYYLKGPELWLTAVLAVVGLGSVLLTRDAPWIGDPLWGQETIGIGQVVVLPLVAGSAALLGWRDRRGIFTFVLSARGRVRHLGTVIAANAVALLSVYAVATVAVILASSRAMLHLDHPSVWPLLTQTSACVMALCVGYAIGYALASWLSAVIAASLTAGVLILDRMGALNTGFAEYTASGSMYEATPNAAYFIRRLLWMWVLVLLIVAVLATRQRRRFLYAALVLVVLSGTAAFRTNESYRLTAAEASYCSNTAPRVCGPEVLATRIDSAGATAARASTILGTIPGLTTKPPASLEAWYPGIQGKPYVMLFDPGKVRAPLHEDEVVAAVVSPTSCQIWTSQTVPPDYWFEAAAFLRSYVGAKLHGTTSQAFTTFQQRHGAAAADEALASAADAMQECETSKLPRWFLSE